MAEQRGFSLKDQLFNAGKVSYLAGLFADSDPKFDRELFEAEIMSRLLDLELKERIVWISEVLERCLPEDFETATGKILQALPLPLDPELKDDDFGDFIFAPLGEYVSRNGVEEARLGRSLFVLKEITKRFSAEFAIRPFLAAFPLQTMAHLASWAGDENYHVRRLVSEGSRPTLPWGKKTGLKVDAGMMLLERLYCDNTRYVTRSVANHLNDVAKHKPELVVDTLTRWAGERQQESEELAWMTRHALRVVVKRGHPGALELLGYRAEPDISVSDVTVQNMGSQVRLGEALEFEVDIRAKGDENLMVDYAIEFVKADGSRKPKVFKLKQVSLEKGQGTTLIKRHKLLANATTFRIFPGLHRIVLQVNGVRQAGVDFEVLPEAS